MLALTALLACFSGPGEPEISSADCADLFEYVPNGALSSPELNLIGVYEGEGETEDAPGQVEVNVERETEMVLVLSSYDAVDWRVTLAEGTVINEILVTGYHAQSVSVPGGVPVTIRSHDQSDSSFGAYCGYAYPAGDGCDTNGLIGGAESETGLDLSSFGGCYSAGEFSLK